MSKRAFVLAGLALFVTVMVWGWPRSLLQEKADTPREDVNRHAFLQDLNLENDADRYALLLHPLATGDGVRAVTDAGALMAAQPRAFYTDNPGAALRRTLLSIVFLSPPGMPPSNRFVTVVKDKETETEFTCYAAYCNGTTDLTPRHERDLAGLLEASQPVEYVQDSFAHHDKARAAHFRLLKNPDVVLIDPPNLPAPGTLVFPHRVILNLPAILLETDATGETPVTPFDQQDLEARFRAAFTHAYPKTDEYRLGAMNVTTYFPPERGWPVVSDQIEGYLQGADGVHTGLDRLMVIEPSIAVELHAPMQEALLGPDAFALMPEFLPPEPPSVADRLSQLAAVHLGGPCPDCFKIELPVATVDGIRVDKVKPIPFILSYYRIVAP